jgi:phosphate/sulfate permease
MPKFDRFHYLVIAAAVASVAGFAWPHTWAEVFAPSFIMPALGAIAAAVVGILSKAPSKEEK